MQLQYHYWQMAPIYNAPEWKSHAYHPIQTKIKGLHQAGIVQLDPACTKTYLEQFRQDSFCERAGMPAHVLTFSTKNEQS